MKPVRQEIKDNFAFEIKDYTTFDKLSPKSPTLRLNYGGTIFLSPVQVYFF